MVEDGAVHREPSVTGEAHIVPHGITGADSETQEETRDGSKRCEVADESVVV